MKKTRWLSMLLAVVMVLSAVPAAAWANGPEERLSAGVEVVFHQESARSMLPIINDFRTGKDAWEWNENNTKKIYHTGLKKLTYDYHLEQIAMQRAVEVAVTFEHTRPNGERCFTASYQGTRSYAENILAGSANMKAEKAFQLWQETEEPYAGQGHRRNMLDAERVHIGIACVSIGGYSYWVQEFGFENSGATETAPEEGRRTVPVELDAKRVMISQLTCPEKMQLEVGESAALPTVQMTFHMAQTWPEKSRIRTEFLPQWRVEKPGVISVSRGVLTGTAAGETALKASVGGQPVQVRVRVVPPHVHAGKLVAGQAPTCTGSGTRAYYQCSCGKVFEDAGCTREIRDLATWQVIPATGHDWGAAEYRFAADGSTCTARRTCRNNAKHQETAQAAVTGKVTREATCTRRGETTYTAVFSQSWAKPQTKTLENIPMAEHRNVWVIDRQPTTLQPGQKHRECTVCGQKQAAVEIPCLPLEAPAVMLERRGSTGKPVVTWEAVSGARAYEVWCSENGGKWTRLYSTERGTRVNHGSARPGATYRYQVRAMRDVAGEFSPVQTILCTCAQPQVQVTLREDKPYLTWDKVTGAARYEIWCSVDGGAFDLLHTTEGTQLRNGSARAGERRSYQVRAICGANQKANSLCSETVSVTCPLPVLEAPVIHLQNKASTGKPYLTWEAVDGAETYEVWRREGRSGPFERIYTTKGTRLTNSSTEAGVTYDYQVRAMAGEAAGPFSAVKHRTCDLPRTEVTAVLRHGDPYLTWNKVAGAVKYEVWCADGKGEYTRLYTTSGTHLTHGSARSGHTYSYKVRAICANTAGNSAYSTPVSVRAK